jgi:hypothetical protein
MLMPVTIPEIAKTLAIAELLLVHIPDGVGSVSVLVSPTHMTPTPAIGKGLALTMTGMVAKQPEGKVYVIVTRPANTPVTKPLEDPTVAMIDGVPLHIPPAEASVSATDDPEQTLPMPVIPSGEVLTVTLKTAMQPVPIL